MEKLPASEEGVIERLISDGYAVYRRGDYIVVATSYLDHEGRLQQGLLVDALNFGPDRTVLKAPKNHQMYFVGTQPYDDQQRVLFRGLDAADAPLFDGKRAAFYWSWKRQTPQGQWQEYDDLYDKFISYIEYITGPARAKYGDAVRIAPFEDLEEPDDNSPFAFHDMNSARANLSELNRTLQDDVVAVIGAGGTGSYIVDFLTKSPVKSIKVFDKDTHDIQNAFRTPGATVREEFGQPKVDVLEIRYRGFHKGLEIIEAFLDEESEDLMQGVTFAFVAVDKVASRRAIAKLLRKLDIPFVNVGMGLKHGNPGLIGAVETSLVDELSAPTIFDEIAGDRLNEVADDYDDNIQTVELNALNAAYAVLMYKRYRGYYAGKRKVARLLTTVSTLQSDRDFFDENIQS